LIRISLLTRNILRGESSYYKILGVHENASNHELRKAFCKLSIELHPDTTALDLEEANKKFQKVLEAYENLNNSTLRKIYDEKLNNNYKYSRKINSDVFNNILLDNENQNLVENRRPYSNGEMFSLLLLIIIITLSLIGSVLIASFSGNQLDTIPIWLTK